MFWFLAIAPKARLLEIYRGDRPLETLKTPATLSSEAILSGFMLNLSQIWLSESLKFRI